LARTAPIGVTASLLLAVACGNPATGRELAVHDTLVVVETSAPFAQQADFPGRVETTIGAALAYWGGTWSDLAGFTITITDAPSVACGGSTSALGCQEGRSIRLTTRDPGIGTFACVEQTVLVHEIGHAVIGDPHHADPRWMDLEPVALELSGRIGYAPEGEQFCVIYVSVWRHLLGVP
jgi:hypothetical protein